MKYVIILVALMFSTTLIAATNPKSNGEKYSAKKNTKQWKMIWNDEFNKSGMPDQKKYGYEDGLIRNSEEQNYMVNRKKNSRIEKGSLIIEAHKEQIPNKKFGTEKCANWMKERKHSEFSSASLTTQKINGFQYGRIEFSAKLPKGQGVWPALWMMGTDRDSVGWPKCGEIDILEYVNSSPKTVFATCHWHSQKNEKKNYNSLGGRKNLKEQDTLHDQFHIYALEWDENKMKFFFDDDNYFTFDISDKNSEQGALFHKPYYFIMNLAIGGAWGGKADPSIFPKRFEIDFVRIYKPAK